MIRTQFSLPEAPLPVIPPEMWGRVFHFLPLADLGRIQSVSQCCFWITESYGYWINPLYSELEKHGLPIKCVKATLAKMMEDKKAHNGLEKGHLLKMLGRQFSSLIVTQANNLEDKICKLITQAHGRAAFCASRFLAHLALEESPMSSSAISITPLSPAPSQSQNPLPYPMQIDREEIPDHQPISMTIAGNNIDEGMERETTPPGQRLYHYLNHEPAFDAKEVISLLRKGTLLPEVDGGYIVISLPFGMNFLDQISSVCLELIFAQKAAKIEQFSHELFFHYLRQCHIPIVYLMMDAGYNVNVKIEEGNTPLHDVLSSSHDSITMLYYLLNYGAEINAQNKEGNTPLHVAVSNCSEQIIEFLIHHEANLTIKNCKGQTPLLLAIDIQRNDNVRAILEKRHSSFPDLMITDKNGDTPLHYASYLRQASIIELLLQKGAYINITNRHGQNSLHKALSFTKGEKDSSGCHYQSHLFFENTLHTVQKLVEAKADLSTQDVLGNTPLHYLPIFVLKEIKENKTFPLKLLEFIKKIFSYLLSQKANPNTKNRQGNTPFHLVVQMGCLSLVKESLTHGADPLLGDYYQRNALHLATFKNDHRLSRALLETGIDKEKEDVNGRRAIHFAAAHASSLGLSILLSYKADIAPKDHYDRTPLHYVCSSGVTRNVQILIQNKVPIDPKTKKGETPLILAIDAKSELKTEFLLRKGANPYLTDSQGNTILHHAVLTQVPKIVSIVLSYFYKINTTNMLQETPLLLASKVDYYQKHENKKEILKMLIGEDADPNILPKNHLSPLYYIVSDLNKEMVDYFLFHKANPNSLIPKVSSPLHKASSLGLYKMVVSLLKANANPNVLDEEEKTPLHLASSQMPLPFGFDPIEQDFCGVCHKLVDFEAKVTTIDRSGNTPLHYAANHTNKSIVGLLVEQKADVNCVNNERKTPLHFAANLSNADTVPFLIEKKANVNALDHTGNSPLHFAVRDLFNSSPRKFNIKTIQLLIANHANVNGINHDDESPLFLTSGEDPEIVNLLLNANADVQRTVNKTTVLHSIAIKGSLQSFSQLLDAGVAVDSFDVDHNTVLHLVLQFRKNQLETPEIAKLLIGKAPQLLSMQDMNQDTPLHLALLLQYDELITLILSKNPDVNIANKEKNTPLHIAVKEKWNKEVIAALFEKGADPLKKNLLGKTAFEIAIENQDEEIILCFWECKMFSHSTLFGSLSEEAQKMLNAFPFMKGKI